MTHANYTSPKGTDLSQGSHVYGLYWNETRVQTYIDNTLVLDVDTSNFFTKGGWKGNNPWIDGGLNAPFDQRFYLIMNLAVGGTNGYFPDGLNDGKPWADTSSHADNDFWSGINSWAPSWTKAELVVDSVRVWQTPGVGDYAYRLML
jgi:hypothetical protein